jgi:hypothetical protein
MLESMMNETDERFLIYFEDEEHIVRRLGAAAISCWDQLPRPVRAKLMIQAAKILDEDSATEFDAQLKNFVKQHTRKRRVGKRSSDNPRNPSLTFG